MRSFLKRAKLVWILLLIMAVGHIYLATQRHPLPVRQGFQAESVNALSPSISDRIRVSTFNIHRGIGLDEIKNLERANELIIQDDVSGLQEVQGAFWFDQTDQAELIGKAIDRAWIFSPTQTRLHKVYTGNALISRFPVGDWFSQSLVWLNQSEQNKLEQNKSAQIQTEDKRQSRRHRKMLVSEIEINKTLVKIIITHLDRGPIRLLQLKQVLQEFEKYPHVILLGDLNTLTNEPYIKEWLAESNALDAISQYTDSTHNSSRVDWIIAKGFNFIEGGMQPEGVSDHPYYWASLELEHN